jgi:CBS domain-containing protein
LANATPAPAVLSGIRAALAPHAPFSSMTREALDRVVRASRVAYFAPGEVILAPSDARPALCYVIRQGRVRGERDEPDGGARALWVLEPGEVFPLAAHVGRRGVTSRYRAEGDVFCLAFPAELFDQLAAASPAFQDFCTRRLAHLLDLSSARLQAEYAASVTESHDLGTPLARLVRGDPVTVAAAFPLGEGLKLLDARRIGSLPVVDAERRPLGIFTRQDVIGRVVLAGRSLATPIAEVMSAPAITLAIDATAGDAAMAMARHGIRHVVVTDAQGRVAGVVSERDLFALQRLSVRELTSAILRAPDIDALRQAATDIRALSHVLVAQGVASGQLTRLIASLNDRLTARVLDLIAPAHDLDGLALCWLGMGSEGRGEQTIATDQDNGLIFVANDASLANDAIRERLLPFARAANEALDACGYPLCKGGVMAMNPRWCASLDEWRASFAQWIDRGDPKSLLASAIFFDFRSLWGEAGLAAQLRDDISRRAAANPRFLKQMSDNALQNRPPLNWFGGLSGVDDAEGVEVVDLKMGGSVPFVDGARIFALASGVTATNTVERLREAGAKRGVGEQEGEVRDWIDAFEFVQLLRLRTQHRRAGRATGDDGNANAVAVRDLSELDRRILVEALRQAQRLQQRLALDYPG